MGSQVQARIKGIRSNLGVSWRRTFRSIILVFFGVSIALFTNLPLFSLLGSDNFLAAQPLPAIPIAPILPTVVSTSELRGVWMTNIDSDVLFSRDNLDRATQRLKRLNFNTIYPTVWNGGYTLYPSAVAEKTYGKAVDPEPRLQNRDMLAEAIDLGHQQGLAVIPWFEFGLMSEERAELTRQHPDWLTSRKDGSTVTVQGDRGQHRFVWLNPARPEVQTFLSDMIAEVVSKYKVDGIQLDDHFGIPVDFGYDDFTVALYQKDHNGKRPPDNQKDPEWIAWRARLVTDLMVKIFANVKTTKPNCIISLSPNPKDFSYANYSQDWYRWVQLGFVNELIVQVYRSQLDDFKRELERPEMLELRRKIPVGIGILTGLRVLNVDMKQIETQVKATRDRSFHGFSFFFYETLGDRDIAFQSLLANPANRPDKQSIAAISKR